MKITKTSLIAQVVSFLNKLNLPQLKEIVRNFDEFKTLVISFVRSTKEKVSLQCLKDNAKACGWNQGQQGVVGQNMTIVPTPKDVWSLLDMDLLDTDPGKFGQATITAEEPPFRLEDIGISYRLLTERDLFPNQTFVKMSVLKATRKIIRLVDGLNQQSIKKTGKPRYYVPGLETQQFFHDNKGKIPNLMKDGDWYHYVAASFRNHNGNLNVPCSGWNGSSLNRDGYCVSNDWDSNDRFLVLEIIFPET